MGDVNAPDGFTPSHIKGRMGKGKIVGSYMTRGAQVKGESQAEYQEAVEQAKQHAAEALDKTRIPRRMADYVRDYIDSITPERQ